MHFPNLNCSSKCYCH